MCTLEGEGDTVKKIDGYDKWDIERAAETLTKAKDIKANSKLHTLAIAHIANAVEVAQNVLKGEKVENKVRAKMKSTFKKKG